MRRILITGGAGYIGSHTWVELLGSGYLPVIVDDLRNSSERALEGMEAITGQRPILRRVDCCDVNAMDRVFREDGPFDGVIHFAAYKSVGESVEKPTAYYANNIGSLTSLLTVARSHGVRRIVFSSSCSVYGIADSLPVTEGSPAWRANSPYGFTKVVCEQLLRDEFVSDPHWNLVLLRYFNPIGAHPSGLIGELPIGVPNNLVPYVVQTAAGIRKELVIHGKDYPTADGTCERDYIHVMDLARAHVKALDLTLEKDEGRCEIINLGTGRATSVQEVVDAFVRETGVAVPVRYGPRRPGDVPAIYAETTKSARVLGWTCEHTVADALRDAWRWQQNAPAIS